MLLDTSENTVIANLGWVDRGHLWTFDVAAGREATVAAGEAKYLSLLAGTDDHFAAAR